MFFATLCFIAPVAQLVRALPCHGRGHGFESHRARIEVINHMSLKQLIDLIKEPNKSSCLAILNDNKKRFEDSPGSLSKHQAWSGGYIQHLEETMSFGYNLFNLMNSQRKLGFSLSDVVLVLFLHDLEKPFRYVDPKKEFLSDKDKKAFIEEIINRYKIVLDENHRNALDYIHGEGNEYNRIERIQKPLAAFVHVCDVVSARIWFDYPKHK